MVQQAGYVRTAQLAGAGCSSTTIRALARSGWIEPVPRGLHRQVGRAAADAGPTTDLWVTVLSAGTATVWRRSAAAVAGAAVGSKR
jgi:hypothetical protein